MQPKAFREYTPVLYPESSVKVIHKYSVPKNTNAVPLHWHKRMELLLVREGELDCSVNGQSFTLNAGGVAIVEPYRPHGAISGKDGAVYDTVMFDISDFYNQSLASKKYLTAIIEGSVKFKHKSDDLELVSAIDRIIRADLMHNRIGSLIGMGGVYEILALLFDKCLLSDNSFRTSDTGFKEIFAYIEEHLTEELTTGTLSREFGYNEAYFCRQFKKIAGINAMKYILILRLERAAEELMQGNSIGDTAISCGFCNINYFSNCFKRHFGISPSEYRSISGK